MMVTRELGDPFRRDALALPVRHLDKVQARLRRNVRSQAPALVRRAGGECN